jgi:sugar phosphate isomerase/epimerase
MQLYSARLHPPIDKVLGYLAELGYAGVEGFGGVYADVAALRAGMDRNGLSMPTAHFSLDLLVNDRPKVLAIARGLGVTKLVAPYVLVEARPKEASGWRAFGRRLARLAAAWRDEGLPLAWHNHDFEFTPLEDGAIPHEILFAEAPLLDWEIDVAWIKRGKSDPFKWIKSHAGSITSVHIKDIAKSGEGLDEDGWADIGHGTLDWPALLAALRDTRCVHFVVEHDKPSDFERFARRSLETLAQIQGGL